jgi:hypothetical protein
MVRQHRILSVIFDERANWRAHIFDAKARALKKLNIIKSLSHTSWGSDQLTILPTIRYGEVAYGYGSATKAILKRLDPVHHKGVSLSLRIFAICWVENLLCEAGLPTLPEMRERDTAKSTIRILTNTEHSTRHLYTSQIYDYYATKSREPKLMFIRAMEYLGRFGIDTRKI